MKTLLLIALIAAVLGLITSLAIIYNLVFTRISHVSTNEIFGTWKHNEL